MSADYRTREGIAEIRAAAHKSLDGMFDSIEYDAEDRAVNDINLTFDKAYEKVGLDGLRSTFLTTRTTMTFYVVETAASLFQQIEAARRRDR